MVSGTRLVTGTVQSARTRRSMIALLTVKSIKQRAGIQPNGLRWVTTTNQWFAPSIFPLVRPLACKALLFCTGTNWHSKLICMIGEQEHTVWSGKPDIYGWEIYPKMYERRKSLSTSSGEYSSADERRVCVFLDTLLRTSARLASLPLLCHILVKSGWSRRFPP